MLHLRYKLIFLLTVLLFSITANCQLFAGGGFGAFNIPTAAVRGSGPTFSLNYSGANKRQVVFLDVSYLSASAPDGDIQLYNGGGQSLGLFPVTDKYSYADAELSGNALFGSLDKKKLVPYAGGGIALILATTRFSYKSDTYQINDDVHHRRLYCFCFNTGLLYKIKPIILELKGTLGLATKPLVDGYTYGEASNVLMALRLSIMIPLIR